MLLVQLMELLSMYAFLLINKYHIEVVGEENAYRMLWQFVILTLYLGMLLLDGKEWRMIQES